MNSSDICVNNNKKKTKTSISTFPLWLRKSVFKWLKKSTISDILCELFPITEQLTQSPSLPGASCSTGLERGSRLWLDLGVHASDSGHTPGGASQLMLVFMVCNFCLLYDWKDYMQTVTREMEGLYYYQTKIDFKTKMVTRKRTRHSNVNINA